jgi:prepilin-type processing-associated H-X9-DG protein
LDLTRFPDYALSEPQYRHNDLAVVGWLDGHAKSHHRGFVEQRRETEAGIPLVGEDQLVLWNRW